VDTPGVLLKRGTANTNSGTWPAQNANAPCIGLEEAMFRSVKFINTLTQEQWAELGELRRACGRFNQRRMHGYGLTNEDREKFAEDKPKLAAMNDSFGITGVSIYVTMKNVNDERLYDIVEAPPFLHKDCMLPALIEFIISTIDDRHNAPSAFNAERPWEFWNIQMPANKGVLRRL
jgi:hypothetical protein